MTRKKRKLNMFYFIVSKITSMMSVCHLWQRHWRNVNFRIMVDYTKCIRIKLNSNIDILLLQTLAYCKALGMSVSAYKCTTLRVISCISLKLSTLGNSIGILCLNEFRKQGSPHVFPRFISLIWIEYWSVFKFQY